MCIFTDTSYDQIPTPKPQFSQIHYFCMSQQLPNLKDDLQARRMKPQHHQLKETPQCLDFLLAASSQVEVRKLSPKTLSFIVRSLRTQ